MSGVADAHEADRETAGSERLQALRGRLTQMLSAGAEAGPGEILVENLTRVGIGRSRENWRFDLRTSRSDGPDATEPLILRCDPPGGLVDTDRTIEFRVLQSLVPSGLPAPRPRCLDGTGRWLGRPGMVMHREPGTCEYDVLSSSRPLELRVRIAERLCDLLASVHGHDWRSGSLSGVLADPGEHAAEVELERWEAVLHRDEPEPYPELDLAIEWLRACAPRSGDRVLVHGDFKPGNVLLVADAPTTILDWELAHLGDPMEDLGWVLQPLRRREQTISGHWDASQFLARYRWATGIEPDIRAITWWSTFATLRTGIMQVSGLRAFLDGRSDQPYRLTRKVVLTLLSSLREVD